MKTTGVFSRVHPNLPMMLHSPLYKAENSFYPFSFTECRKDKVGLGHFFLLALFSYTPYIWDV